MNVYNHPTVKKGSTSVSQFTFACSTQCCPIKLYQSVFRTWQSKTVFGNYGRFPLPAVLLLSIIMPNVLENYSNVMLVIL